MATQEEGCKVNINVNFYMILMGPLKPIHGPQVKSPCSVSCFFPVFLFLLSWFCIFLPSFHLFFRHPVIHLFPPTLKFPRTFHPLHFSSHFFSRGFLFILSYLCFPSYFPPLLHYYIFPLFPLTPKFPRTFHPLFQCFLKFSESRTL